MRKVNDGIEGNGDIGYWMLDIGAEGWGERVCNPLAIATSMRCHWAKYSEPAVSEGGRAVRAPRGEAIRETGVFLNRRWTPMILDLR